jgi:hypothetical protein
VGHRPHGGARADPGARSCSAATPGPVRKRGTLGQPPQGRSCGPRRGSGAGLDDGWRHPTQPVPRHRFPICRRRRRRR